MYPQIYGNPHLEQNADKCKQPAHVLGQAKYPAEISNVCKPKEIVDLDRSVLWNVIIDPIADDLAHQQNINNY